MFANFYLLSGCDGVELNVLKDILGEPANDEFAAELDTQVKTNGKMTQPRSQGLSSYRPLRRARRDPGSRWSRAALSIANIGEGSSVIRQFAEYHYVLRLTLSAMFNST